MERTYLCTLLCAVMMLTKATDEMSEIRISPETDKTLSIGADFVLTCFHTTEVVSKVKWIGPGDVELRNEPPKVLIEKEPGRQILTLSEISEEDTGMYHCEGFSSSANATIRESRELSVIEPIRIVDTPPIQIFEIGTTATVLCSARGRPEPTILWLNGTDKIDTSENGKFTILDGSSNLIIENISKDEEGIYICKARELIQGQNKIQPIEVRVYVPPEIHNPEKASSLTATEGTTIVLDCNATGDPEPTYSWHKGDGSALDETTFKLNGSALELNITRGMSGESFVCIATNYIGSDMSSVSMTVNVKPYFTVSTGAKVQEKGQAVLRCVAEGDPIPEVYFYYDDIMLEASDPAITDWNNTDYNASIASGVWSTNQRVIYNRNEAIVNFTYTDFKDAGKYECRAVNEAGMDTATVFLDVEYAPKSTLLNNVWACEDSLATLECEFYSNPPAKLSWGRYNTTLEGTDEMDLVNFVEYNSSNTPGGILISQVNDILTLTIDTSIVPEPWGTYYCLARNSIGSNNATADLNIAEPPDAPIGVEITDIGTRTAKVSFTVLHPLVDNSYFTITLAPASPHAEPVTRNLDPNMSEYYFEDLEHDMQYRVIVEAVNCADISPPSESKVFKTKAIVKPEAVEIISGESSENHDKYLVKWETRGVGGGEVSKITIVVNQVIEEIDEQNKTKVAEFLFRPGDQEFQNGSVVIEDLSPSSRYEISVGVFNEVGSANSTRMFLTAMAPWSSNHSTLSVPEPENTSVSSDAPPQFSMGGVDWKLILIIIAVLLLLVVLIDVICFFTRSWGITMWIYAKTCGKSKKHKVEDAEEGSAQFSALGKLAPIDEQTPLRNDKDAPSDPAPAPSGNGSAEGAQEATEEKVEKAKSPEEEKLVKAEENEEKA